MDEANSYQLWEHIQKIMWFHILLARNKIFPSLIPVNSHVEPKYNDTVLKKLPSPLEIQSYASQCFGNHCLFA